MKRYNSFTIGSPKVPAVTEYGRTPNPALCSACRLRWSLILTALGALAMVVGVACGPPGPGARGPTRGVRNDFAYHTYPAEVRSDCEVVVKRCNKCHTLDRVLVARVETRDHWRLYVERMRRMSGSGISRTDADAAVNCLAYRSELATDSQPEAQE